MIHQPKVELQERINERERVITIFGREIEIR